MLCVDDSMHDELYAGVGHVVYEQCAGWWQVAHVWWHVGSKECYRHVENVCIKFDTIHPLEQENSRELYLGCVLTLSLMYSWIYLAWNFHLVMSLHATFFGDRFRVEQKGWDMGRWVGAPKGCKQHGHRLCFRNTLVGTGWAISVLLCTNSMPSLGSALETPWLALDGPFLSSYAQTGWENSLLTF